MNNIISMFLDNELDLDDKMEFVTKVHEDKAFKDQTIELLQQEKLLCSDVVERSPEVRLPVKSGRFVPLWRPFAAFGAAIATALIIWMVSVPSEITPQTLHRFVIYRPDVSHAEISGSFTQWHNLPMERVGNTGYWEITLGVPRGEHRFVYILDGQQRFTDPTVPDREKDDFGGENSILSI
ncbi:1,4-alpha-glucan branching enzyme [uncultured Desulfobacterium sp.]|uniref:1,4-alpha-glucan branching enzyme n=1 Tax=uncultured Desulfobacterium sp. TaxID=201089 RepID=A0A445N0R9_9BACT|nr:1,4-alpha-glucan branching enzyme [uncultured Desulfobacterium sp.]